jgi:hypothetical protein
MASSRSVPDGRGFAGPAIAMLAIALLAGGLLVVIGGLACDALPIWLPDFESWAIDSSGYTIERLPVALASSYARGNDVYFGLDDGRIFKADDTDLAQPWTDLHSPLQTSPRMLFATSNGVVLASENGKPVWRTEDGGATWTVSLDVPAWRMDEDDLGNLYVGNYTKDGVHVATLYRSADGGLTWDVTYQNDANDHIHTVRWDNRAQRLYIAYGDSSDSRGHAYSDDRGATWVVLGEGSHDGPTDVALTADYIIWASDDQSGEVSRVSRRTGYTKTLMGRSQFMWFAVTDTNSQIYVGTVTSAKEGGERAALLASFDEGTTWQKLMQTPLSNGPYDESFRAESRVLSANGWLYCTGAGASYRIRRSPE